MRRSMLIVFAAALLAQPVVRKPFQSASKQVLGDIGVEAKTTVEAWPLGADLKEKPLYAIMLEGTESRTVENALLVFDRGLEEVECWSVYKLGNGSAFSILTFRW